MQQHFSLWGFLFIIYRFNLGVQDNFLTSNTRINDGNWHTVKAFRSGRDANLTVDAETISFVALTGVPQMAVDGDLFLGMTLN